MPEPLESALDAAGTKPDAKADRDQKKNYAQRLSNALAQTLADALRSKFPAITPTASGEGQEATVPVSGGSKRLDVKVIDPVLGLTFSVSIKTYSFQDYEASKDKLGRWTKNIVRNDHELRSEAMVLHQRQPYSVLFGVLFAPLEMCDDGDATKTSDRAKSSFAHAATTLGKRAGRGRRAVVGAGAGAYVDLGAEDPRSEMFERVFIALYQHSGPDRGSVRFFDVEQAPPRNGRPDEQRTISFDQFVEEAASAVAHRNRTAPTWAEVSDEDADAS